MFVMSDVMSLGVSVVQVMMRVSVRRVGVRRRLGRLVQVVDVPKLVVEFLAKITNNLNIKTKN